AARDLVRLTGHDLLVLGSGGVLRRTRRVVARGAAVVDGAVVPGGVLRRGIRGEQADVVAPGEHHDVEGAGDPDPEATVLRLPLPPSCLADLAFAGAGLARADLFARGARRLGRRLGRAAAGVATREPRRAIARVGALLRWLAPGEMRRRRFDLVALHRHLVRP